MAATGTYVMPPLAGRHALVTGGSRGIGLAIARALAKRGADITVGGRSREDLEVAATAIAEDHGVRARAVRLNLGVQNTIQRVVAAAADQLGPVTILVNNAGIAPTAKLEEIDLETWRNAFDINVTAALLTMQTVLPGMRAAGWGRIVNIASTAGLVPYSRVAPYVASKHALVGLTRAAALDLAKTGITVNAVCPGYTETDMAHRAMRNIMTSGRTQEEARALLAAKNPQGRLVQVDEVAETVAWLCLASSSAITGQSITVAGGEVM